MKKFFSILFIAICFALPCRAQFVTGNIQGAGNVVAKSDGSVVSETNNYGAYFTGTAYSLTNAYAAVVGGTTSPSITLGAAGTYYISGFVQTSYNLATFAAAQTQSYEFYRTNNTPGAITGSPNTSQLRIITTTTDTAGAVPICGVVYTTTNANDVITIYGTVSVAPSAGSLQVTSGAIFAIRLY